VRSSRPVQRPHRAAACPAHAGIRARLPAGVPDSGAGHLDLGDHAVCRTDAYHSRGGGPYRLRFTRAQGSGNRGFNRHCAGALRIWCAEVRLGVRPAVGDVLRGRGNRRTARFWVVFFFVCFFCVFCFFLFFFFVVLGVVCVWFFLVFFCFCWVGVCERAVRSH